MKHCPECNKNYADPTLSFCLIDGTPLIFGQAVEEPVTAILSGDPPSVSPTQLVDPHTTAPTEALHSTEAPSSVSSLRSRAIWVVGGVAVLAAVAIFAAYRFIGSSGGPVSNQIESVAVLPFENGSGDPSLDYLSDGLSESLIDKLSELPQLKVIL